MSAPDPAPPLPPPLLPLSSEDVAYRTEADRLAGTDTMADRMERLRAEVDALQVNAMRGQRPWYREIASIVAVLALVFSFGTTFVSYDRTASQDSHDKRVELRSLIERLTAISREITETAATYRNDPAAASSLNRYLNQEQILDAKQAARIMAAISNQVGAAEYTLVAVVLIANSIDDLGLKLLDQAVRAAADANDLTGALRYSASRRFELGDAFQGRLFYDRATHVFDVGVFPSKDAGYVIATQFDTQASWAFSELHYGTCDLAKEHFADAKRLSDAFPATDPRRAQMAAFEADVTACQPRPDPTTSPSPAVAP